MEKITQIPEFKLEPREKIVLEISRSKFGLISIWASNIFITLVIGLVIFMIFTFDTSLLFDSLMKSFLVVVFMIFMIVVLFAGLISTKVYRMNRLYVTNKRLIQISAASLFAKSVNIIELTRIEDVSFTRNSFIDLIFHMGTLRMSTVGDETTYTFPFVNTPTDEVETIARLIHQLKKS